VFGIGESIQAKATEIKTSIKTQQMEIAMAQREVMMAVSIAQARDSLQWFGGLYSCFLTGLTIGVIKGKAPAVAAVPAVMGCFGLLNLYDVAYGNKMIRVRKEAELILVHERRLFPPPAQAPFAELYSEEEMALAPEVSAVGSMWPSFFPHSRQK
jgi:hypothetical protein